MTYLPHLTIEQEIKLEIIRLIRTRIGEISMSMGDYYYLIQKLEELKTKKQRTETNQTPGFNQDDWQKIGGIKK